MCKTGITVPQNEFSVNWHLCHQIRSNRGWLSKRYLRISATDTATVLWRKVAMPRKLELTSGLLSRSHLVGITLQKEDLIERDTQGGGFRHRACSLKSRMGVLTHPDGPNHAHSGPGAAKPCTGGLLRCGCYADGVLGRTGDKTERNWLYLKNSKQAESR